MELERNKASLKISLVKTEEMYLNNVKQSAIWVGSGIIKRADVFCYLVSYIYADGGMSLDVTSSIKFFFQCLRGIDQTFKKDKNPHTPLRM